MHVNREATMARVDRATVVGIDGGSLLLMALLLLGGYLTLAASTLWP